MDLFINFGIGFLSSSKKAFNPFFIFKFVKYINRNNIIKFALKAIAVYFIFFQNISTSQKMGGCVMFVLPLEQFIKN